MSAAPAAMASALDAIGNTPVVRLRRLVPRDHAGVFVKLEYFNPTGSSRRGWTRSPTGGRLEHADDVVRTQGPPDPGHLDAHPIEHLTRRPGAFDGLFRSANPLLGPVEQRNVLGHVSLLWQARMPATPAWQSAGSMPGSLRRVVGKRSPGDYRQPDLPQRSSVRTSISWEKAGLERLPEVHDPGRAAGAALEAGDALDRLHVAEAPEQEVLLHVDQLLAHVVLGPVALGVFVDRLEHRDDRDVLVGLRPVALDAPGRHR